MDDPINKPFPSRDAEAPAVSAAPPPNAPPGTHEADGEQEHDFDIVFEFETDEDQAN